MLDMTGSSAGEIEFFPEEMGAIGRVCRGLKFFGLGMGLPRGEGGRGLGIWKLARRCSMVCSALAIRLEMWSSCKPRLRDESDIGGR